MQTFIIRSALTSAVVFLAACNNGSSSYENSQMQERAEYDLVAPAPQAKVMGNAYSDDKATTQPASNSPENPSSQSFLAYRYNYGFSLPAANVAATAQSHADICLDAGPSKCQILASNTSRGSTTHINASLRLRAEPDWLKSFQDTLQSSVEEANGDMTHSGVSAEDLTRSILDTGARLKAQKTLRARLEKLLETRDAKLPDLLSLERELARVQGQIESATTTLNVLKKRVSMSVIDINYQSKQVAVSRGAFSPITRSLKRFAGNVAHGVSDVIDFISHILPWMLFVILPGLWLLRRFWRRRKSAPSKA